MVTHFGAVSLSSFLARTCTNVIYGLIFLLLLQRGTPANAQPDWTAVKAKMNANAKELDQEFVFVLSSADSTLLLMETKTFTTKSQVPFFGHEKVDQSIQPVSDIKYKFRYIANRNVMTFIYTS